MTSPDLTQANIDKVAELFPSVVTETLDADGNPISAIDFDALRQELSDHIVDGPQERYRLDWPGKRASAFAANAPIAKTLRPVHGDSVEFDNTRNIFIEGDNLDALKLLQESYLGKIKLIYIDPPYNTGSDFVYNDVFAETASEYLERSGQVDDTGARLLTNPESNGRFHSDWLSMMYPRLKLARNLLRDDGVIVISIDDNEVENLTKMCNEVFGERCFLGTIAWLKKRKGSFLSKGVVSMHEYAVVFGRTPGVRLFGGKADASESQPLVKRTNPRTTLVFPANHVQTKLPDGVLEPGTYGEGSSGVELAERAAIQGGVFTDQLRLTGPFVWGQAYLNDQIARGGQVIINTMNLQPRAFKAPSDDDFKGVSSVFNGVAASATNEDAYEYSMRVFGSEGVMDYPKPVNYIRSFIQAATESDKSAIILDFFAGSGTTADAVYRQNAEDGGTRRFIAVQLPEQTAADSAARAAGFATIADLARHRIKWAAQDVRSDREGTLSASDPIDLGFRVFRVDSTNMTDVTMTPDEYEQGALAGLASSTKEDRNGDDLLFQVLLNWGLTLDVHVSSEQLAGHNVHVVDGGTLIACFDAFVDDTAVRAIAEQGPLRAVFRDSAFASDADRINAEQIFRELSPSTELKAL